MNSISNFFISTPWWVYVVIVSLFLVIIMFILSSRSQNKHKKEVTKPAVKDADHEKKDEHGKEKHDGHPPQKKKDAHGGHDSHEHSHGSSSMEKFYSGLITLVLLLVTIGIFYLAASWFYYKFFKEEKETLATYGTLPFSYEQTFFIGPDTAYAEEPISPFFHWTANKGDITVILPQPKTHYFKMKSGGDYLISLDGKAFQLDGPDIYVHYDAKKYFTMRSSGRSVRNKVTLKKE